MSVIRKSKNKTAKRDPFFFGQTQSSGLEGKTALGRAGGTAPSAGALLAKRCLDIMISFGALVFFAPLMVLIALSILLSEGGPVFFAHERIGLRGQRFACLKFRTMALDAEERLARLLAEDETSRYEWGTLHKLRIDPRITTLGRFLRLSSLDEIPQFINVLKGEMSIVGPRPIVEGERWRYGRRIETYEMVKPGLTGLWQVTGRNEVSYRRRVATDMVYCRYGNFALDLWIIIKTPAAMLRGTGH